MKHHFTELYFNYDGCPNCRSVLYASTIHDVADSFHESDEVICPVCGPVGNVMLGASECPYIIFSTDKPSNKESSISKGWYGCPACDEVIQGGKFWKAHLRLKHGMFRDRDPEDYIVHNAEMGGCEPNEHSPDSLVKGEKL